MKLLKWLLVTVVVLGIVLVGGSLFLPATTHVERSASIEAPPAVVFATLDSFEHFNEWSPWAGLDPATKYDYSGPASGVGSRMDWVGNASVGSGSQEILESVPHSRIVNALEFDGNKAKGTYAMVPEGAGTRVTFSLDSEHGYNPIHRWLGALAFDRMVGSDYEKGLAKLKALLESQPR